jgi:hypothetical protein
MSTVGSHPPRRTITLPRRFARIADLALAVFLVALALTTAAQVRHNLAAGPHGRAPHDPPVATRQAPAG